MADATNQQVQQFVNERLRPFAEHMRSVQIEAELHRSLMDDIYTNVSNPATTFTDTRTDGPPHLVTPNDVLAMNTFMVNFLAFIENEAQWSVVQQFCVRPLN